MRLNMAHIDPAVQKAVDSGAPVIALETTIMSHGMPYPTNMESALAVEAIIRAAGVTPATIGIIDGTIKIGLNEDEIRFFSTAKNTIKAGERDIPLVIAKKLHAATTTGSTLAIAAAAGIRVFVTGGIGGVGPDASTDFDISADLLAIAQYPCLTVCAGAKAFMDVAGTLEFLETQRVPVMVYRSEDFPLFYSRHSGHKVDWVAHDTAEIADCFAAKLALDMPGGMLVATPLPEADALPESVTQAAIAAAMERIKANPVAGKAVTPFLLSAIKDHTGGKSLAANVALIKNNATIGAQIAVELTAKLKA